MTCQVDVVFFADCAARAFFDQVANKWSVMILTVLSEKPTRFNEMRRKLEGITHKALTQALRRLERNGLIARDVLATSPVAVEYSITELGRTLQVPFGAMYAWSIDHLHEIEQAQQAYDRKTSADPAQSTAEGRPFQPAQTGSSSRSSGEYGQHLRLRRRSPKTA